VDTVKAEVGNAVEAIPDEQEESGAAEGKRQKWRSVSIAQCKDISLSGIQARLAVVIMRHGEIPLPRLSSRRCSGGDLFRHARRHFLDLTDQQICRLLDGNMPQIDMGHVAR
jgi:hypothetical protein